MKILVANIGSTSFKFRLFDGSPNSVSQGKVERIGQEGSSCPTYAAAIQQCLSQIVGAGKPLARLDQLDAIGFKAVHAGPCSGARLVDDEVLSAMADYSFFAPAHNPPYIAAMKEFRAALPGVPLVALFETAFFDRLEPAATTYAVPYAWGEQFGIRRYGFHGASHRAASDRVRELLGTGLRHISCHLGGSSSMAAIRDGVAIDTTFGISPQSGLPQSNRVGDIDSFAVLAMMKRLSLGPDEMADLLGSQAGLAGLSGTSGDVRDLQQGLAKDDGRCRLAIDAFVYAVRRYLGAFFAELNGLDVITFTGGIGENAPGLRGAICRDLGALGIALDSERNQDVDGEAWIEQPGSKVRLLVMPADEERVVARAVAELLAGATV